MGGELVEYVIGVEKHDPEKEDFDPDRPIHFHAYFCCEMIGKDIMGNTTQLAERKAQIKDTKIIHQLISEFG